MDSGNSRSGNVRSSNGRSRLPSDLAQAVTYLFNNPDVEREIVRNNPHMREMVHGNPENLRHVINNLDPETRETLTNPQRYREMMSNIHGSLGRGPQNQATNPATTGGIALKPTVILNVRVLNGPTFSVKASLESTVDLFKFVLEKSCHVPPAEQRLVFKGRIFYEDQNTLKSYGLKADDTVHLVRGSGGLTWFQRTPSQLLGRRTHIIQAMHDSNPKFREIVKSRDFDRMCPPSMSMEQMMTLHETVFSMLTRGPVPPEEKYARQIAQVEEMGFMNARDNVDAVTAHAGNVYAAVELLEILSKCHH